jgi:hypothetical protein
MTRTAALTRPEIAIPGQPYRPGAVLALLGVVLLALGTWLHPAHADRGAAAAAFTEYAATGRGTWVAAHMLQFGGIAGMSLAMVLLSRAMADAGGAAWTRVTAACGAAGLATAATLQAVDGVALKAMVDLWAGAANDRSALFAAALAVRQVEIGLDALLALVLAATFLGFGVGLLTAPPRARSLGVLVLITAGAAAVNGVALALGGFSDTAMLATTASGVLAMVSLLWAALWSWRQATIQQR